MNKTLHKLCVLSIVAMMPLFLFGVVAGHIFPPPSPLESAETVAQYYRENTSLIRLAFVLGMIGGVCYAPFSAAIAWEVRRMTGRNGVACYLQIILGTITTLSFVLPWPFYMAAAFRPERPAEILHAQYDIAWMMFMTVIANMLLQLLFLGYAMLADKRATPTFPRWFAYFTLFAALDLMGSQFVVMTKTGPFAWDGVISFWLPLFVFGFWINGMVWYLLKAAEAEHSGIGTDDFSLDSRVDGLQAELAALRTQFAEPVAAKAFASRG